MKLFIIGLGWLGQRLAQTAIERGFCVAGTKRKVNHRDTSGAEQYPFELYKESVDLPLSALQDSVIVLNIAAGRTSVEPLLYFAKIKALVDYVMSAGAKHLIFISSTSVFAGHQGRVLNSHQYKTTTPSGHAHELIETYLLSNYADKANILRLAGLVGVTRHPVYTLAKRPMLSAPKQAVNLIHQDDVVSAILRQCENLMPGTALNLCSNEHPSRQDYYQWCAKKLGLNELVFAPAEQNESTRIIDATESWQALGIQAKYPSPYDMLPD